MRRTAALLALLAFHATSFGQVTEAPTKTPIPTGVALPSWPTDPLAVPFPIEPNGEQLVQWALSVKLEAQKRLTAARTATDRAEAARLVLRADQARLHALRELRRLRNDPGYPPKDIKLAPGEEPKKPLDKPGVPSLIESISG